MRARRRASSPAAPPPALASARRQSIQARAMCQPKSASSTMTTLFDYFYPNVFPFGVLDVPADAHEHWDGPEGFKAKIAAAVHDDLGAITQVFDVARMTCDAGNHETAANCAQDILAYSVFGTNDLLETADGWPVSNEETEYRGSEDDAALNAGVERYEAGPAASAYRHRYYRPSGLLQRPLVTLHTTRDPGVPYRHELRYFSRAALLGTHDLLTVLPVDRAGHCEFTAEEVLGGFGALWLKSDSDLVLALVDPLEALHDVIDVGAGAERVAEFVQDQARDFVDELEDEFGFLDDARDGARDALDEVQDVGGSAKDTVENLF
jgi:hypothetical protein